MSFGGRGEIMELHLLEGIAMESEEWRDVPGHGSYEVSSLGRLRRKAHTRRYPHPKTRVVQDFHYAPKLLKPITTQYGYQQVNIDGEIVFLHRVVLSAFVGECPDGFQACHGNGIRADNRVANLRWDSPESNREDRARHGRMPVGPTHPSSKYPESVVNAIRDGSLSQAQATKDHGISPTHYYRIKRGEARKRG